jgi:hypothetical protein
MVSRHMDAHAKGFKHAGGREGQSPDEGGSHTSSCSPATLGRSLASFSLARNPGFVWFPRPAGGTFC